ncbi:hypothetical protein WJX77_008359 [Trebouxia sp. C0004]
MMLPRAPFSSRRERSHDSCKNGNSSGAGPWQACLILHLLAAFARGRQHLVQAETLHRALTAKAGHGLLCQCVT